MSTKLHNYTTMIPSKEIIWMSILDDNGFVLSHTQYKSIPRALMDGGRKNIEVYYGKRLIYKRDKNGKQF